MRTTVTKLERDMTTVKKNTRTLNNLRHSQPQFALVPAQTDDHHVCSANDVNPHSGIRKIRKNFFAFCEMDGEDPAGWILIQNRYDGSTEFFRTWSEYKDGFGNIAGEFWMGLEKIYELTSNRLHELMIEMESFDGVHKYARYSTFGISDEASFYTLSMLGPYSGDADDSLAYHAGMKFSTFE